jgi:hypothetical protein
MWWATLKTMVWKTPLKYTPTPCKNSKNQHQKDKGHNPWMDCAFGCLKTGEKNKKMVESWVCERMGKKWTI